MKQEKEIIDGNKLIAEFMDCKINNEVCFDRIEIPLAHGVAARVGRKEYGLYEVNGNSHNPFQLKYHSSWDWLMPVVEKIGKMNEPFIHKLPVSKLSIFTPIEEVFHKVVDFIKWYNQQSPKP